MTPRSHRSPGSATQRFAGALAGRLVTQFLDGDAALLGTVAELDTPSGGSCLTRLDCRGTRVIPSATVGRRPPTARRYRGRNWASTTGSVSPRRSVRSNRSRLRLPVDARRHRRIQRRVGRRQGRRCSHRLGHRIHESAGRERRAVRGRRLPGRESTARNCRRVPAAVTPDTLAETRPSGTNRMRSRGSLARTCDRRAALAARGVRPLSAALERVRPATTTGLGLGNTVTEALLTGLYEVIERDAAMLRGTRRSTRSALPSMSTSSTKRSAARHL